MRQRLSWILATVLPAIALGFLELRLGPVLRADTAGERLWLLAWQGLIWTGLAVGVGALMCLGRTPPRGAAVLAPPLAAGTVWILGVIDPTSKLPVPVTVAVALALLATTRLILFGPGSRVPARLASAPLWFAGVMVLGGLTLIGNPASRHRAGPTGGPPPDAPNVLLISLDTCRIDFMGPYQAGCELTPHLDALAAEAVVFDNVAAPMPLTGPSHVGMLTGLAPVDSGVTRNGVALDADTDSLPRHFARRGYRTAAFVSGLPLSDRSVGLGAQFEHYDDRLDVQSPVDLQYWRRPLSHFALRVLRRFGLRLDPERFERAGEDTVDRTIRWLNEPDERPFFAFCHLYDLHHPYQPPSRWQAGEPGYDGPLQGNWNQIPFGQRLAIAQDERAMRHMRRLYAGEMQEVDLQVGRLLDELKRLGHDRDTLVVLTSDHGESLDEHGIYYDHATLHDVEIRIPLIVRLPDRSRAGQRVAGLVSTLDLPATLLELVGLEAGLPGRSLAPALQDGHAGGAPRFATATKVQSTGRGSWSVTHGTDKLILVSEAWDHHEYHPPQELLFDLAADPGETVNGASERGPVAQRLLELLAPWIERHRGLEDGAVDAALAEQLRALGYGQ